MLMIFSVVVFVVAKMAKTFTRSKTPVHYNENVCVCVCVCGWNELEVCTTLAYPHISSFRTMPVPYTSTRTLKPFEDSEPTGLKVDIAN